MPKVSFDYAALQYLNQWLAHDKKYQDALSKFSRDEARLRVIKDAAVFYKVARNLPREDKSSKSLEHYLGLLKVFSSIHDIPGDDDRLISTINTIATRIEKKYKSENGVVSLTTKFLWLRKMRPVIIYDNKVRVALGTKPGDLGKFYSCWRHEFEIQNSSIKAACVALPDARRYVVEDVTERQIKYLAKQIWFQERVLDVYLWHS